MKEQPDPNAFQGPKSRILIVIDSDPRTSSRVGEAVRMAGGVSVWKQVEVYVVLRGAAALALGEGATALPDGKIFGQFIGMIRGKGGKVSVMPDKTAMEVVHVDEVVNHSLKEEQFMALTAEFDSVMRF